MSSYVKFRCFQTSFAFKTLDPFFPHLNFEYRSTPKSSKPSIRLHGFESQLQKIDSLHCKALHQFFQIKSSYYHGVLHPTDSPCSNEYLLPLSYPILPTCVPSSIRISDARIDYLDYILRYPQSPEFHICF